MKIKRVQVSGLHGLIRAELAFDSELAIIVGVNGAGKTSILNLIAHVLKLNIAELARVNFDNFVLEGEDSLGKVQLSVERVNGGLNFVLDAQDLHDERLVQLPEKEDMPFEARSSRYVYERSLRRMYDSMAGSPLAEYLRQNVRLSLVRLDRSLFAEEASGQVAVDQAIGHRKPEGLADPIDRVDFVTRERYNKYRVLSRKHNEDLTKEIVMQLFRAPKNLFGVSRSAAKLTSAQIDYIRKKIAKLPFFVEGEDAPELIKSYFELAQSSVEPGKRGAGSTKDKGKDKDKEVMQWIFRDFEFPRINGLMNALEKFERSDAESRGELDRFENLINSFLVESGKEVFFSEREASLRFRVKGSVELGGRPINELSSGEKQIVTMLTYLAFMAGENCIFVVDEPELSLHLSWQMKLVEALLELCPDGGQLILATHSPEIVGKFRRSVVKLAPEYAELETAT